MTEVEKANLKLIHRYEDLYNTDPERFVRECYTADVEVHSMAGGTERILIRGHDDFIALEKRVHAAAPRRRMKVIRALAWTNFVIVEAELLNPDEGPDWHSPFCAILQFRSGLIHLDRTYVDPTHWPGLDRG